MQTLPDFLFAESRIGKEAKKGSVLPMGARCVVGMMYARRQDLVLRLGVDVGSLLARLCMWGSE